MHLQYTLEPLSMLSCRAGNRQAAEALHQAALQRDEQQKQKVSCLMHAINSARTPQKGMPYLVV